MSDDKKLYKKLPPIIQTTAIKNFFDSTVEQLFSKANVEQVQGYIGSPSSDDVNASGKFIPEQTITRRYYGLTPAVNTLNTSTGKSENLVFYDEFIDTLKTYGVETKDHNKIFAENYATFLPPVNIDKFVNYQEYYWYPAGPSKIVITGTQSNYIDVHRDVTGKEQFTPSGGKAFRNGMIVEFSGDFVTPTECLNKEYIVAGVGEGIKLIEKDRNLNATYTSAGYTSNSIDLIYKTAGNKTDIVTYTAPQTGGVTDEDVGLPTTYIEGETNPGNRKEIRNVTVGTLSKYNGLTVLDDGTSNVSIDYTSSIPTSIIKLVNDIQNHSNYANLAFTVEVATRMPKDYLVIERGAKNETAWSRLNCWHHRDNFLDAGDSLPPRTFRAERPIIEFDKDLEMYNHGTKESIGSVVADAYNLTYKELDGSSTISRIDGVPTDEYSKIIFSNEQADVAKYIYKATKVDGSVAVSVDVSDSGNVNAANFEGTVNLTGNGRDSVVESVTITNGGDGFTSQSNITVNISGFRTKDVIASAKVSSGEITEIVIEDGGKGWYKSGEYKVDKVGNPDTNPNNAVEGDANFVAWEVPVDATIHVQNGNTQLGKELIWGGLVWNEAQQKSKANQPPLFNLYSTDGVYMADTGVYPTSTFNGSRIFGYAESVPEEGTNMALGAIEDPELGMKLVYKTFNATSEIVFENYIETEQYNYKPFGSGNSTGITTGAGNTGGPYAINGYYPLYSTKSLGEQNSPQNSVHEHTFFGKIFYMPNGLIKGVTFFHGDYQGSLSAENTTINTSTTTTNYTSPVSSVSSSSSNSGSSGSGGSGGGYGY